MKHTAFFGDGEKTFALPSDQILELERKAGIGFGAIYQQFLAGQFRYADMLEVVRLGLIGGGTSPKEAQALIDAYAKPTPVVEVFGLAFDILDARWSGKPASTEEAQDELNQAAATGDLAAAINAAYADVPDGDQPA